MSEPNMEPNVMTKLRVDGVETLIDYNRVITNKPTPLPAVTANDEGKILRVNASGNWTAVALPNAEEASF